jgi:nicotinate-nucleotide adenylyltransferase
MRLGVFGGSFDPVHYGHLLLAETCREQCGLDEVWFVPADVPPHKRGRELSPGAARVEMLQLAIGGHDQFCVCDLELKRGGVSYTVETLAEIHGRQPEATLFLLMGADTLEDLPNWIQPDRICQLAIPLAVRRVGSPEPSFDPLASIVDSARLAEIQRHQAEMPVIGLSSSEIRQRVSRGSSIRFQTPRAVEKYIETKGLYRP